MLVYILSDYDEYGAENVKATLDPARLPALIDAWNWAPEFKEPAKEKLAELLGRLAPSPDGHNLLHGWGGVMLHVVELV
jgi:hypothetical protein